MSFRLSASRNASRLVMMPNFEKIIVFGPSRLITSAAYLLRPETTEITATIVVTAMMIPSRLRNERSLWATMGAEAVRATSLRIMPRAPPARGFDDDSASARHA